MPKRIAPLAEIQVRNAKPAEKNFKLFDGGGLFLLVTTTGGKLWRLKYRIGGQEKKLTLGAYPEISLSAARLKRDEARQLISQGIDPAAHRQALKASKTKDGETFELIAREWHSRFSGKWSTGYAERLLDLFTKYIFPWLGKRPISSVIAPELLQALRRIEAKGALETAHRVKQICGQVFRYAVATGRAERDPAADLRGALPPAKVKHMATMTVPKEIAGLMRAIDDYQGQITTRYALQLAPLLFVRPGELRHAEWSEIDFDTLEWRLPAGKMKAKAPHIVPLCRQAVRIILDLKPLTGGGRYLFPSIRTAARPMSEMTVNAALRRMGFTKEQITGHGFHSMASTLLNEQGWNRDAIERQLAHAERNNVRAAYNHAEYLQERRRMMQAWADYLDALKAGAVVIPFKAAGG